MDKRELIEALNGDLSRELAAIIQYVQYSARVKGPWRTELRTFFQAEIADELIHAQYLADRIASMGGVPTTVPAGVPDAADAESMLRAIRDAEDLAVRLYTERARQAEALGEIALKVQIENFISDEENHRRECDQILAGWR